MNDVRERALRWLREDPDPETREAVARLLEAADDEALAELFGPRLPFGTAGLRGALGPGPSRMNRALVRRVTAGLAAHLLAEHGERAPVVVGFDARRGSRVFAEDTARVLAGAGLSVRLFDDVVPTPLLAFAVRELAAAGGVMVTASHNPPGDNGYKVYAAHGGQIVPPDDVRISERIDAVGSLREVPAPELDVLRAEERVRQVGAAVRQAYVARVLALRVHEVDSVPLRIVYTPLHGVGRDLLVEVLERAGHAVHVVPEQGAPDGAFPTVRFPNPEEPGALDLALALARQVEADLLIANDPDADRLAVAVPGGAAWRSLSGNEVGALLGEDLLASGEGSDRLVATTLVSSLLLGAIARHHGVGYAETLTGFKWIAQAARRHEAAGGRFVFGYEEALGYCIGDVVRDKDGISAALLLCDLVRHLRASGRGLLDLLDDLHRRHGVHLGTQRSLVLPGREGARRIASLLEALRDEPPHAIGAHRVREVIDVGAGEARELDTGAVRPLDLPRSHVLAFLLEGGHRVLVRPSGTEPKLKSYVEVVEPVDGALEAARERAASRLDALVAAFAARLER